MTVLEVLKYIPIETNLVIIDKKIYSNTEYFIKGVPLVLFCRKDFEDTFGSRMVSEISPQLLGCDDVILEIKLLSIE